MDFSLQLRKENQDAFVKKHGIKMGFMSAFVKEHIIISDLAHFTLYLYFYGLFLDRFPYIHIANKTMSEFDIKD